MKTKKIIISVVALVVIFAAVFSIWHWQKNVDNKPTRQDREIRQ